MVSVSQVGPFERVALVVMPLEMAEDLTGSSRGNARSSVVLDGVMHDLDSIRERDAALADSALAASAISMAYELENPYNSATSKSMCARSLLEALDRLRELCPPPAKADGVDDLADRRARRLAGQPATETVERP